MESGTEETSVIASVLGTFAGAVFIILSAVVLFALKRKGKIC